MKKIKVANGQGFWGDSIDAPVKLIKSGQIDYLTLDYLAEVTMSIMQKQKLKNPDLGYAQDFVKLIENNLEDIVNNNIKIIANAGGVNPKSCSDKIIEICKKKNINLKIGIIEGDDIYSDLDVLVSKGADLTNMDTGKSFDDIKDKVYSANVYIDSFNVAKALDLGAQIVLAGRVTDPGLALGPMIHEFNWTKNEFDLLASGTLAGHILECGAQCTGGNYTNWEEVPDLANIGYPIVEIDNQGKFTVSKLDNTGGLININTVSEQILYEMGDPKKYISPDVIVDFTSFDMVDMKNNAIFIDKVKGSKATDTFKVSISYFAGYKATGQLTISGPNAIEKAKLTADIIWTRLRNAGFIFEKTSTEFLGYNSCHLDIVDEQILPNEIVLRLGVKDNDKSKVNRFGMEIAPVITSGPPGITGFSGGRPKAQAIVAYWPTLIKKDLIKTKVTLI